mmetsp:Transcript_9999/g.11365  ORF Transcript_9999/g.11365 Transcript_9999/m.11365 type:complete len:148 (+) Transcript_9999:432-875(+)
MDDYEEYSRMARLMTKIHAMPLKKSVDETDENENILTKDTKKYNFREERKEKIISGIKFEYKHSSNLDVSMEEEDKEKEPLQNFSNMVLPENKLNSLNNSNVFGSHEESSKPAEDQNSKISGEALFGGMADLGVKKPKNKKKKVRRL